jgi:chromosome segregation ATPase
MQLEEATRKIAELRDYLTEKTEAKVALERACSALAKEINSAKIFEQDIVLKQQQVDMHRKMLSGMNVDPYQGTLEQLMKELNAIENSTEFAEAEAQKQRAQVKKEQHERELPGLQQKVKAMQQKIAEIHGAQRMVDDAQARRSQTITDALTTFRFKGLFSCYFVSHLFQPILSNSAAFLLSKSVKPRWRFKISRFVNSPFLSN